ncbi:hypothetical protein ACN38_g8256 [Penicillium nordicum]|uniref:Uncharacterized protein n=1 Tax=Penicillium nordicum TaxID=229535 RepID=A0A0N0RYC0_9EURO|nr:hypothetical protein ACN38_g8256 [Penicillium nordicum]
MLSHVDMWTCGHKLLVLYSNDAQTPPLSLSFSPPSFCALILPLPTKTKTNPFTFAFNIPSFLSFLFFFFFLILLLFFFSSSPAFPT